MWLTPHPTDFQPEGERKRELRNCQLMGLLDIINLCAESKRLNVNSISAHTNGTHMTMAFMPIDHHTACCQ